MRALFIRFKVSKAKQLIPEWNILSKFVLPWKGHAIQCEFQAWPISALQLYEIGPKYALRVSWFHYQVDEILIYEQPCCQKLKTKTEV